MTRRDDPRVIASRILLALAFGLLSPEAHTAPPDPTGTETRAACAGFPQDIQAIRHGAKSGDAYCQAVLGAALWRGIGVEVDDEESYLWSKRAWEANEPLGLYSLGRFLKQGKHLQADPAAEIDANRRARAAFEALEALDPHSAHSLGYIIENGADGTEPDPARGCSLYEQAAIGGNPISQFNHAVCLGNRGLQADALEWYERSAAGGFAPSATSLASQHLDAGRLDAARESYARAAEIGGVEEKLEWARLLEDGVLGPPDPAAALAEYLSAAKLGSSRAQYYAGWLYYTGAEGVGSDVRAAMRSLRAAAAAGDPDAINMLAALGR